MIPDVVQEIPGPARREVLGDKELGPDPLEVTESPGGVRGQSGLRLPGVVCEEMRNRSAGYVPVKHRGQEGPLCYQYRRYGVPGRTAVRTGTSGFSVGRVPKVRRLKMDRLAWCRSYTGSMPPRISDFEQTILS